MKTLGELILTDFDAARPILEAWAGGERLEWLDCDRWRASMYLTATNTYRIPARASTVDWSQVGPQIEAFVTNAYGYSWACYFTPKSDLDTGWVHRVPPLTASLFPSFIPGTMPWQDSKITRPEGV